MYVFSHDLDRICWPYTNMHVVCTQWMFNMLVNSLVIHPTNTVIQKPYIHQL